MILLLNDLVSAWRSAARTPKISLLILLTFALGIGANSAIFSLVYHVILAPLPYADGDRLVRLQQHQPVAEVNDFGSSVQSFFDYRRMSQSLEELVEYHSMQFTLLGQGEPTRVQTGVVSWNYFRMLGKTPVMGRDFASGEDEPGAEPLILLSHRYWQSRFGGRDDVVGMQLEMNNAVHTVIGVLPPLPAYPNDNDIYITAASCPFRISEGMINNRGPGMLTLIGKLSPDTSFDSANREVSDIARRLADTYPDDYPASRGYSASVSDVKSEMVGDAATTLYLLLTVSTLVVIVASANVANLNLARQAGRSQELAVREALGANRRRIAAQLLTESTLFAMAGGLLGLTLAVPAMGLLSDFASRYTPLAAQVTLDSSVLLYSLAVSLFAGILSGSAAAFQKRNINNALKEGGDKVTASQTGLRWRQGLMVVQVALSFVILTVSALITTSLYRLHHQDAGFNAEQVLAINMDLNFSNYTNAQQVRDFANGILADASTTPGVELASVSGSFPLSSNVMGPVSFETEAQQLGSDAPRPTANVTVASEQFHRILDIPLLQGRYFTAEDDEQSTSVVLINQTMAQRYFAEQSPLQQRISVDNGQSWLTIVGVVGDVRSEGLDQSQGDAFYVPFSQRPIGRVRLLVKSNGDPLALRDPIVKQIHQRDPQQAIASSQTLAEVRAQWLASPTLIAQLIGGLGVLAVFITLSGVVGVVAFSISQRTRELGIRLALGATHSALSRMLLSQGMRHTGMGIALGALCMPMLAPAFRPVLYQTPAFSPGIYLVSAIMLFTAAALAISSPTRQATRLDPSHALRNE